MQMGGRTTAFLELLPASTRTRLVASYLLVCRLGQLALMDSEPMRQPVGMHAKVGFRYLERQPGLMAGVLVSSS